MNLAVNIRIFYIGAQNTEECFQAISCMQLQPICPNLALSFPVRKSKKMRTLSFRQCTGFIFPVSAKKTLISCNCNFTFNETDCRKSVSSSHATPGNKFRVGRCQRLNTWKQCRKTTINTCYKNFEEG